MYIMYNNAWYKYKSVDSAGYQKSKQTLWSAIETWTFFLPHFLGFFKLPYPLKYTLYDLMRKIISILFLAFPI